MSESLGTPASSPWRVSLLNLFYAVLLLGAALGVNHPVGYLFAVITAAVWIHVFWFAESPRTAASWGLILVGLFLGGLALLDGMFQAVSTPREVPRRFQCANNLKSLGLALHTYHSRYGPFPPAYVADENGEAMHSWRTLILPYLEGENIYRAYDFTKPWDDPRNRRLAPPFAEFSPLCCPSHPSYLTPYRLVTGPGTLFVRDKPPRIDHVKRPCVIAVEEDEASGPWSEPKDFTREEAIATLMSPHGPHHHDHYWYVTPHGRQVLLSDGSAAYIPGGLTRTQSEQLLAFEPQPGLPERIELPTVVYWQPRHDNRIKVGIFAIVALLPLPWAIFRRDPLELPRNLPPGHL